MNEKGSRDRAEAVKLRPPWPRKRWQLIVLCAGIFVCGGLVGSSLTASTMHRFMVRNLRNPDEVPIRMLSRMRRDLDLSDEQAEKVLPILRSKHQALAGFFRATLDSAHAEVRVLLDDDQAAKWDAKTERMRAHIFGAAAQNRQSPR